MPSLSILDYILISLLCALVALLAGHFLLKDRDKSERFSNAADELRSVFNKTMVNVESAGMSFYNLDTGEHARLEKIAFLNFRDFLKGATRDRYDEAWENYVHNRSESWNLIPDQTINDIQKIIEFTNCGMIKTLKHSIHDFFLNVRFRLFGPDEKMKELIERISKRNN